MREGLCFDAMLCMCHTAAPTACPRGPRRCLQGGAGAIAGGADGGWALSIGALVLGLRHIGLSGYGAQVRCAGTLPALHAGWW